MLTAATLRLLADAAWSHANDPREDTAESRRRVQALRIAADDARQVADSGSGYGTPETLALAIVIDNDRGMAERRAELVREVLDRQNARAAERGPVGDLTSMTADEADAALAWQRGEEAGDIATLADALGELVERWAGFEGMRAVRHDGGNQLLGASSDEHSDSDYTLPDVTHALARAAFRNVDWIGLARHYVNEARLNA